MSSTSSTKDKGKESQDSAWNDFLPRYAHIYCDLRSACDVGFESEFGDQEQCRKEVMTNENKGRENLLDQRDCSFDVDQGEFCIDTATVIACEEWLNDELSAVCGGELWDCD